ncbi:MAG: PIN domain-containing protein [Thermosynechococcaceae cyanobacterium MS004]|nr:PIN domain-containing protein [Thermosynechococcaceae cyanobacterium MS004]
MIVLDTHIWFWMVTQDWKRFPAAWRNDIELADQVGVSPISCYEIVLAEERGRLELPCAAEDWFRDALEPMDIVLLPLNAAVACRAVELSPVHKDPFDRLIIATALVYDGRLASVDGSFPLYSEIKNRLLGS